MRAEVSARPLLLVFLGLVCGVGSGFSGWALVGGLVLLGFCTDWKRGVLVGLSVFAGWAMRPHLGPMEYGPVQTVSGEARLISVVSPTAKGGRATAIWKGERISLRFEDLPRLVPGDTVRVSGEFGGLVEGSGYLDGARARLKVSEWSMVSRGWDGWRAGLAVRDSFRGWVDRSFSAESAGFVKAVCFGDTSQIEPETWEKFRRTGTAHVVSTSGLHAAVAAVLVMGLLSLLPVGRVWQLVILGAAMLVYASAAGFGAPIIRAATMLMVWQAAYLFRREPDGLSSLALAGVVNIALDPFAVGSVGLWLSTVAVGSLVMFMSFGRDVPWWKKGLEGGGIVWVGTAPVLSASFGGVSLSGLLLNLLVIPIVSGLVIVSLSSWLVGLVVPAVGRGAAMAIGEPLARLGMGLVEGLPVWVSGYMETPFTPVWLCAILVFCLAMMWRPHVRPA